MIPTAEDQKFLASIEICEKEYEHQAKIIFRFNIIRSLLLFIIVHAVVSALSGIESGEGAATKMQLERLCELHNLRFNDVDPLPKVLEGSLLHLIVELQPGYTSRGDERIIDSVVNSDAKFPPAIESMTKQYLQGFLVRFSVVGTEFVLDLRIWFVWLPVVFILSETYLSLLRKKRKISQQIGQSLFKKKTLTRKLAIQLVFNNVNSDDNSYRKYPAFFVEVGCAIVNLILGGYYFSSAKPIFFESIEKTPKLEIQVLNWALISGYLVICYYCLCINIYVAAKYRKGISRLFDISVVRSVTLSLKERLFSKINVTIKMLGTGYSLTAGSILVLSTLVLPTFYTSGCYQSTASGYEYLRKLPPPGSGGYPMWPSTSERRDMSSVTLDSVGRAVYIVSVGLSIFGLAVAVMASRKIVRNKLVWTMVRRVVIAILLLFILSVTFDQGCFSTPQLVIWPWISLVVIWVIVISTRRALLREWWKRAVILLLIVFAPLLIFTIAPMSLSGRLCFLIGATLLSIGFHNLSTESSSEASPFRENVAAQ